jgi:hypothetical protein
MKDMLFFLDSAVEVLILLTISALLAWSVIKQKW